MKKLLALMSAATLLFGVTGMSLAQDKSDGKMGGDKMGKMDKMDKSKGKSSSKSKSAKASKTGKSPLTKMGKSSGQIRRQVHDKWRQNGGDKKM